MLKDRDKLLRFLSNLLPSRRPMMWKIWKEMNLQMANFVRGKAIEIVIVGLVSYVAFLFLGLNYAALLALLVGLSVIVPYVGALLVTIPVSMVAYLQWGWGGDLFLLLGVYAAIQALDGNVLVPLLFSEAVNLHPVSIILAVILFGGIWGFWGVFFSIPLATLIKEVTEYNGKIVFNKNYPDGVKRRKLSTKILDKLGWKSKIILKTGLKEYYRYFIKEVYSQKNKS